MLKLYSSLQEFIEQKRKEKKDRPWWHLLMTGFVLSSSRELLEAILNKLIFWQRRVVLDNAQELENEHAAQMKAHSTVL